jgi:hypothetical protein
MRVPSFLILLTALVVWPTLLRAQRPQIVVHIQLHDSTNAPIGGVNVVLLRDSSDAVAFSVSNAAGQANFVFDEDEKASYSISTRKLGYTATERSLDKSAKDTITLSILLARIANLDTVRVVSTPLKLERQPYVDAAEIAKSTRSILSLRDVIGKLRPEIDYQAHRCVVDAQPVSHMAPLIPIARGIHIPRAARVYVNGRWIPGDWDPWNSIYAEHIAEIRYVNCMDKSIPGLPDKAFPSVYVQLKPGYTWDLRHGSYQIDP